MSQARLNKMLKGLESFRDNIQATIKKCVETNEHFIVEIVSEDQLYEQGVNSKGVKIADYRPYRPYTVEVKLMKGQKVSEVTLRDEGEFAASFFVMASEDEFYIDASDWKKAKLIEKYSRFILGLTDENKKDVAVSYVLPGLRKELINKTR